MNFQCTGPIQCILYYVNSIIMQYIPKLKQKRQLLSFLLKELLIIHVTVLIV